MNKFAIGDIIYLPQDTVLLCKPSDIQYKIINKPSLGVYIGNQNRFYSFDVYGEVFWVHEDNLDKINIYLEREKNNHAN